MHEFVNFNHQITPAQKSFLPAISSAAFYGRGIFTTVAIFDGKPFLWKKHWQRLAENAKKISLDLSEFSETAIENSLLEIVTKNKLANVRARLTFFDETASKIWQNKSEHKTSFMITTANFRAVSENFCLTVSPFSINSESPLAGVKSCNYLENILALENAKANGFDEAIRLNVRGEVASATTANIFWTKNDEIFTPSLETGCLAGTTRRFILEKFAVNEKRAQIIELEQADRVFLTSAGIGIVQVSRFQKKKFSRRLHELAQILKPLMEPGDK